MDKVNVLVVSRLDLKEGYLEEIAAIDPRISVKDGIKQFVAELRRQGNKEPFVNLLENIVRQTPTQKSTAETEGSIPTDNTTMSNSSSISSPDSVT